jgi:hypothetical protein
MGIESELKVRRFDCIPADSQVIYDNQQDRKCTYGNRFIEPTHQSRSPVLVENITEVFWSNDQS